MTNKRTPAPANTDFFDFLWACGKFALIVYVLYRVTVAIGMAPEGFF